LTATRFKKFGFDTEFAANGEVLREDGNAKRLMTAEDITSERAAAYKQGAADALAAAERDYAAELARLTHSAAALSQRLAGESAALRAEAASLARITAHAIAGAALARFGDERIVEIIERALESLRDQPRLLVKLAPAHAERLRARLDTAAKASGAEAAITVVPQANAASGAVSIEWRHGAIGFDPSEVEARIGALVEQSLADAAAHPSEGVSNV